MEFGLDFGFSSGVEIAALALSFMVEGQGCNDHFSVLKHRLQKDGGGVLNRLLTRCTRKQSTLQLDYVCPWGVVCLHAFA